jgi:hypothetical protein
MSVFTRLPQDMLQHEISRFLDPISRAEFNCVLKDDERIYKKLDTDYALKHHIITVKKGYENIVSKLNYNLQSLGHDWAGQLNVRRAINKLKRFFNFFLKPMNLVVVSYQQNVRAMLIRTVKDWLEDQELYEFTTCQEKEELQNNALLALATLRSVTFVRQVNIAGFAPVF